MIHFIGETRAGGSPKRTVLDFSSLFNPLGPPPGIAKLLRKSFNEEPSHPLHPFSSKKLRRVLAQDLDLKEDEVLPVPGRLWTIHTIVKVFKPQKALLVQPTSKEYVKALRSSGCQVKEFVLGPERVFKLCLGEMAWQVEEGTDLVFLCNPNDPTGYYMPEDEVEALVRWCRDKECLLVVDEAFLPFTEKRGVVSQVVNYPNLVVLRDLSHIFNLAGMPLGYIVAQPKVTEVLIPSLSPTSPDPFTQKVGLACLMERDFIKEKRTLLKQEKTFLTKGIINMGFQVFSWATPYFLFRGPNDLKGKLLKSGILVKDCSSFPGLGLGYYRIFPRTKGENQRFVEALASLQ